MKKPKTYKYYSHLRWVKDGKKYEMLTQLYQCSGVYVCLYVDGQPHQGGSTPGPLGRQQRKNIKEFENDPSVSDVQIGSLAKMGTMMRYYHTHIWDIDEYNWYLDHRDMMFTVPACAEYYGATREHKIPLLVMPESVLPRGTSQEVRCKVCAYINMQIKQGTIQDPDIWADLAENPHNNFP